MAERTWIGICSGPVRGVCDHAECGRAHGGVLRTGPRSRRSERVRRRSHQRRTHGGGASPQGGTSGDDPSVASPSSSPGATAPSTDGAPSNNATGSNISVPSISGVGTTGAGTTPGPESPILGTSSLEHDERRPERELGELVGYVVHPCSAHSRGRLHQLTIALRALSGRSRNEIPVIAVLLGSGARRPRSSRFARSDRRCSALSCSPPRRPRSRPLRRSRR